MSDFSVQGADDFLRLSKALKAAGRGDLRKELNKALRDAAKPLTPKTRTEALNRLPSSGGLAARVAKQPQRVTTKTGRDPGVSLVVGGRGSAARTTDEGFVRHPVFGGSAFVRQSVTPGWFTDTGEKHLPEVARDVRDALDGFIDRLAREV